jgi:hypothetical protein
MISTVWRPYTSVRILRTYMNGPLVEKGGALDGDQVQLEEL